MEGNIEEVVMSDHFADVLVHVNESLDEASLLSLEDEMYGNIGVMAVDHNPKHPHLLKVHYDSEVVRPTEFLKPIQKRGLHAQLVGM
jgi:hypothetical protein